MTERTTRTACRNHRFAGVPAADPRVLLIVPTLGRRDKFLAQTLHSIRAQRGERADVVVVAPPDAVGTRKLAAKYGADVIEDAGSVSGSVNAGLAVASPHHLYANWIGDDDLLAPGSLAAAASALDADCTASLAFGYCDYIDPSGRLLWTNRAGDLAPRLLSWGPDLIPQPGALFRVSHFLDVGGLDNGLQYAMDLDLWCRLRVTGPFINTRRTLAAFRWHPTSVTVANRTASLDESDLVKRRYYSAMQARAAFLWERPVRGATRIAAYRLSRRARRLSTRQATATPWYTAAVSCAVRVHENPWARASPASRITERRSEFEAKSSRTEASSSDAPGVK